MRAPLCVGVAGGRAVLLPEKSASHCGQAGHDPSQEQKARRLGDGEWAGAGGGRLEDAEVGGVVVAVEIGEEPREAGAGGGVRSGVAFSGEDVAWVEHSVADRVDEQAVWIAQRDRIGAILEIEVR